MPEGRLKYLLEKFHAGVCTPEEMQELEKWYKELALSEDNYVDDEAAAETIKDAMLLQFRERLAGHDKQVVPINRKKLLWRMVAAAAIVLIAGATVFYVTRIGTKEEEIVKNSSSAVFLDVSPGGNHATLTLADGTSILLDTAQRGGLAQQGISAIHKPVDGLLVYEPTETAAKNDAGVNIISTPRGGQYQVQLPDGSKVWLNAASSIQFPVKFTGQTRQVKITGEVYFEVAPMPHTPFIVDANGKAEVEVLGTHFNINAYNDEAIMKTTLLEGRVKVKDKILKPGQQAQIFSNAQIQIVEDADTEEAIAWKNGLFKFNDADIATILRQAARWYDIDVEIPGNESSEKFRGKISRDVKLSEFLRILEVNQVSFQTKGKKIIIQR